MIKCSKCNARAIIFQKYSGLHLCQAHFDEDVLRKIRQTLRETGVFGRGAKIAVAMSGGKDSSTLLQALKKIFGKRPDVQLVGLLVDEGIEGYRKGTLENARALCDELEVPYEARSFKDAYGITTDEVAAQSHAEAPCTFCGVMRKTLMNRTAREIGADALATGHNLDDEAQTVLLNYLRGDVDRLFRLRPRHSQPGMVRRIKPLSRIPEKESALYALTHGLFPFDAGSCPYVKDAMRLEVKEMLSDFEAKHPGTKYSLLKSLDRILDLQPEGSFEVVPCEKCGEPSGKGVCQCCRLLERVGRGAKPLSSEE